MHVCVEWTWFSCSEPIAWPWSQRWAVCRNACERPSLQDYFCSPQTKERRETLANEIILPHLHAHAHSRRSTHAPSMIQSDDGYWRGNRILVKVTEVCVVTSTTAGYCHCLHSYTVIYCWPAHSRYQTYFINTLHYLLALYRQMWWTLKQMTEKLV